MACSRSRTSSGISGIVQSPGMACYNVAKAGMIALSETMRNELAGFGVGVTVACPSFFKTNLMESYRGPGPGTSVAGKLMDRSRLTADDIAGAIDDVITCKRLGRHLRQQQKRSSTITGCAGPLRKSS